MDKICKFFDKDFEYFLDSNIINKVKKNSGLVGLNNVDTINNNFPENFLEEFKKLVEKNLVNEKIIQDLKNQLNSH
ncbi:hypothetical protein [uncultured Chryseobacterium sp.]|nr:hypothetical protein [uncultured Chryseobacterium sp.]